MRGEAPAQRDHIRHIRKHLERLARGERLAEILGGVDIEPTQLDPGDATARGLDRPHGVDGGRDGAHAGAGEADVLRAAGGEQRREAREDVGRGRRRPGRDGAAAEPGLRVAGGEAQAGMADHVDDARERGRIDLEQGPAAGLGDAMGGRSGQRDGSVGRAEGAERQGARGIHAGEGAGLVAGAGDEGVEDEPRITGADAGEHGGVAALVADDVGHRRQRDDGAVRERGEHLPERERAGHVRDPRARPRWRASGRASAGVG